MTMLSHSMHDTLCFQSPVGVFKRSQDHDIHNSVSYVMQITQKHFLHHIEKIQKPSHTVFLLSLKKKIFVLKIRAQWSLPCYITMLITLMIWNFFMFLLVLKHQNPTVPYCGFNLTPTCTLWEWVWVVVWFLKRSKYIIASSEKCRKTCNTQFSYKRPGNSCKDLLLWPSTWYLAECIKNSFLFLVMEKMYKLK